MAKKAKTKKPKLLTKDEFIARLVSDIHSVSLVVQRVRSTGPRLKAGSLAASSSRIMYDQLCRTGLLMKGILANLDEIDDEDIMK